MSVHQRSVGTGRPSTVHQVPKIAATCRPAVSANNSNSQIHSQEVSLSQYNGASSRRTLLSGLLATSALLLSPAHPASAYSPKALCVDMETEEEDTACRREALARTNKQEDYGAVSSRKFDLAPNVPVAALNDEYYQATLKVSDEIEAYCSMDVYDKQRIPLIKALKTDGNTWVSAYARGGSARTQSARRMYIAVDSVIGHLASNGFAPLPAPKVRAVLKSVNEAKEFLAKGI